MNVNETDSESYDWNGGVYQLEVTDRVQAGPEGIANLQASVLAKRTRNLHLRTQKVETEKAPLASPVLTGTPTAPTAAPGTNTQQLANTAFVQAALAMLVASSPAVLDTLNELAAALGNDPNFAATITNLLAAKAPLNSPGLTGLPTTPTAAPGNNTTQIANTAFVQAAIAAINLSAVLNNAALSGTPIAPTAAVGTNTTQIANTAFVQAAIAALVASSPAALDTLNELAAALGNDANFATTMTNALANKLNKNFDNISNVVAALTALGVEGTEALPGTDIDWLGKPVRTKTLTAAATLTFSNLVVNKTISLKITGAYTLTLPGSVTTIAGEYDGSKNNLIQMLCINATTPEVWCTISQPKS